MFFKLHSWSQPDRFQRFVLIGTFLSFCIIFLIRYQLLNGFAILPGDRYDAVISGTILEHWFLFFTGAASWSEVSYFYPYTRTIAQTDAYFLIGVAYLPFRFFGLDPFISAEFANLVIKSTGFIGTYLLCRKVFSFSFYWALFAAILFTLSNGMTAHSSRIQLATVAFVPIMAILLWSTLKAFYDNNSAKFRCLGLIAGMFYGAWCLTCFYMAWFFAFFFTIFSIVILIKGGGSFISVVKDKIKKQFGSVVFVVGSAVGFLLPFIYAFLPKSHEVGVRSYESVFKNTIPVEDIIQVGNENFMFGRLYNSILHYISPNYLPSGEYYNTGFSIILFSLFVCGCIRFIKHERELSTGVILQSLIITTLVTWILTLNIFGHSAWFFVYYIFPGAKALNVIAAYQLFLAVPVVIVAIIYLSTQRVPLLIVLLLSILLIAGEINKPYLNLDRKTELTRISLPHSPPEGCKVFYVTGWEAQDRINGFSDWVNNVYAHNVSAMMIAQIAKIPTINGVASFNPPDWNFGYPNKSDYEERVFSYSKKHGITDLCRLDLNNKQWTVINGFTPTRPIRTDLLFFKKSAWPGVISDVDGLSYSESWGVWSSSEAVILRFTMPLPVKFNVNLVAHAFRSNVGKEFVAHVGDEVVKFTLGASPEKKVLEFINPKGLNFIKIDVPSPVSPKALGLGSDERNLGIGIGELRITPL